MRIAGIILLVVGIIGTIYYGIQAINQSESFNVFGMEVAVSSANWTPLIISVLVLVTGFVLTRTKGK